MRRDRSLRREARYLTHEEAVDAAGAGSDPDGYAYSALHRPGSWEWHEGRGAQLRERLTSQGYVCEPDPGASWRVRWATEA